MKKILILMFFVAVCLVSYFIPSDSVSVSTAGVSSLAGFLGAGVSVTDIEKFAKKNFSSFNGFEGDLYGYYDGMGDQLLDFGGDYQNFATMANSPRVFTMTVAAAAAADSGLMIKLIPGYTEYRKAIASRTNTITDGTFATNFTGSGSPKYIEDFFEYVSRNPIQCYGLKFTSTYAPQIDGGILTIDELSPFRNLEQKIINFGTYTTQDTFRDKVVSIPTPGLVLSDQTQLAFNLLKDTSAQTVTIQFFCGAILNTASTLKRKTEMAVATATQNGSAVMIQNAISKQQTVASANPVKQLENPLIRKS